MKNFIVKKLSICVLAINALFLIALFVFGQMPTYAKIMATIILFLCIVCVAFLFAVNFKDGSEDTLSNEKLKKIIGDFAKGDFKHVSIGSTDENSDMAKDLKTISKNIEAYIDSIKKISQDLANKNFRTKNTVKFEGDFYEIESHMEEFIIMLSVSLKTIQNIATSLSSEIAAIASNSDRLAIDIADQSEKIERISNSIVGASYNLENVVSNVSNIQSNTNNAVSFVDEGKEKMTMLNDSMNLVGKQSEKARSILTTIENIAKQTSLLSVNASIEAARAGEAGKGFAVVAFEIQELAETTQKATKDIGKIINGTIVSVDEAQKNLTLTASSFDDISDSTNEILSQLEVANEKSQSMLNEISSIKESIESITVSTRNTSNSGNEIASSTNEMLKGITELGDIIKEFTLIDSNNKLYEFTEDLMTGNELIDSEHMQLIDLINKALKEVNDGIGKESLLQTIKALDDYVKTHFSDEEKLQLSSAYPLYEQHKKWHTYYIGEIGSMMKEFEQNGGTNMMVNNLNKKAGELLSHIRNVDRKLAEFIRTGSMK